MAKFTSLQSVLLAALSLSQCFLISDLVFFAHSCTFKCRCTRQCTRYHRSSPLCEELYRASRRLLRRDLRRTERVHVCVLSCYGDSIFLFAHCLLAICRYQLATVNSAIIDPTCSNLFVGEVRKIVHGPLKATTLIPHSAIGHLPRPRWPGLHHRRRRPVRKRLCGDRSSGQHHHARASREQPKC
jgi:hypothetical protein